MHLPKRKVLQNIGLFVAQILAAGAIGIYAALHHSESEQVVEVLLICLLICSGAWIAVRCIGPEQASSGIHFPRDSNEE